MSDQSITVVGSTNTDMVIKTSRLPMAGETILGGDFFMNPGGKGANQAVAAARLGGKVTFVAKTGDDLFGRQAKQLFDSEQIRTDFLFHDPETPSGIALITVDDKAENCIVVAPGANAKLGKEEISCASDAICGSSILLMQLEIPLETVVMAAEMGHGAGSRVILNPAPAQKLPEELYPHLYLITPNETEAEWLTGIPVKDIPGAIEAARWFRAKGVTVAVITLGGQGALIVTDELCEVVPAFPVTPVDTTAAGDCFNGALAVALSEDMDLRDAIRFANKAASLSVTRLGAQASAPHREEMGKDF
ncbi:MAG: ribokinase [Marinilabiliales bacterium]|nr:ribokinase [Marinilabiliales bacterium]